MPQNQSLGKITGVWTSLLAIVLIVALLWTAKTILLPLALGIILAFTLSPLVRLFDRMPTDAERAACAAEVPDWTQLLQVSLADLGTDYAEGTVYFVMRRADLAAREFGRVHAIYQQT